MCTDRVGYWRRAAIETVVRGRWGTGTVIIDGCAVEPAESESHTYTRTDRRMALINMYNAPHIV